MTDTNKKIYELAYFLSSSINEDDVLKHVQKLREILAKHNADIQKEELPKIRTLAYPIRHETEGYFGWLHFECPVDKIKDINTALQMEKDVLRHLIIEVTKKQVAQMTAPKANVKKPEPSKESNVDSVLKEGAKSYVDENKVDIESLDEKLEEILNK